MVLWIACSTNHTKLWSCCSAAMLLSWCCCWREPYLLSAPYLSSAPFIFPPFPRLVFPPNLVPLPLLLSEALLIPHPSLLYPRSTTDDPLDSRPSWHFLVLDPRSINRPPTRSGRRYVLCYLQSLPGAWGCVDRTGTGVCVWCWWCSSGWFTFAFQNTKVKESPSPIEETTTFKSYDQ